MPNTLKRCSMEDGVKGLACSSSIFIFSGDESPYRVCLHLCLENTWNLMMLCSLMCMARLVTLQPVLSGRAFFCACVCCRGRGRHESRSNVCSDMS